MRKANTSCGYINSLDLYKTPHVGDILHLVHYIDEANTNIPQLYSQTNCLISKGKLGYV